MPHSYQRASLPPPPHPTRLHPRQARECYEAFVIYNFVLYLVAYFGSEQEIVAMLQQRKQAPEHIPPMHWCLPKWRKGERYLAVCKRGALQYVVVRLVTSLLTLTLTLTLSRQLHADAPAGRCGQRCLAREVSGGALPGTLCRVRALPLCVDERPVERLQVLRVTVRARVARVRVRVRVRVRMPSGTTEGACEISARAHRSPPHASRAQAQRAGTLPQWAGAWDGLATLAPSVP